MSATVDTTDISYGVGAVANSRPAVFSNISGAGLWYVLYAKSGGTYYATSPDASGSFTTYTAISGLAGRLIGPVEYQATRDMAGNLFYGYPGNHADGSLYMLVYDGAAWTGSLIVTGGFDGMAAHLYEGASTFWRMAHLLSAPGSWRTTSPNASSSVWPEDYQFDGNAPGAASGGFYPVGANLVFVYIQTTGTKSIRYVEIDLDTVPGGVGFPTGTDGVVDASLDSNFAAALDGAGVIHVIYRIAGTGWFEGTYDGASFTTGGTLPQMTDDDRSPALMCDGAGDLHLVYARYNAASDYGIGYLKRTGGSWSAQADIVTHNATNRTSVCISDTTSTTAALITWLEGGTAIKAQALTVAPLGVNPLTAVATLDDQSETSLALSVEIDGGTAPYTGQWYRSLVSGFVPDGTNDLPGETSLTLSDTPPDTQLYYYLFVATDDAADTATSNQIAARLLDATLLLGFFGDSITSQTSGGGISTCEVMASRLSNWDGLRAVVIEDWSAGGYSTSEFQPGQPQYDDGVVAFLAAGVTHVMIMLGTNGISNIGPYDEANVDAYIAAMGNIVDGLVGEGFTVVLNQPPPIKNYTVGNHYLQRMGERLAELADNVTVFLGDEQAFAWFSQHPEEYQDTVHPNILGIQTLGSLWARAFGRQFLDTPSGTIAVRAGFNAGFN